MKDTDGSVIAQGAGMCGRCQRRIETGEKFWWRGENPAMVECWDCRCKRLRQSKLDRDAKVAG